MSSGTSLSPALAHYITIAEDWQIQNLNNWTPYQVDSTPTSLGQVPSLTSAYSISGQNHIDVRTFATTGEGWTANRGTFTSGWLSSFNNWPGLTSTFATGLTTLTSTMQAIDLTTLGNTALLTLALPTFPLVDVSLANSEITLTDALGGSVSLLFSTSSPTPASGNTAVTWPLSALTGGSSTLDPTRVVTVAITVDMTGSTAVTMMALRMIASTWGATNVDYDNLNGYLRQTVPLNGNTSYVAPSSLVLPTLWRTDYPSDQNDPMPIDVTMGYLLYTGASTQTNSMSLFFREVTEAFITQIDLEGDTQASLTGLPQPTLGISEYVPRTMGELDALNMGLMDDQTMLELDRTYDPVYTSWFQFQVSWGTTPGVMIANSAELTGGGSGYNYTGLSLSANTLYYVLCSLTNTTARLQIYTVNTPLYTLSPAPVFDTTAIPDGYTFKRRAGRVGFQAQLLDGNAYVGPVRPQGMMFSEYRSQPLRSITPVSGAQLFVNSTANLNLWESWSTYSQGVQYPTLAVDSTRTTTTGSTRVTITTPQTLPQGVISNVLSPDAVTGLTDFSQLGISMDIWFPTSAVGSLSAGLLSEHGNLIPLNFVSLPLDAWRQNVQFYLPAGPILPCRYQLVMMFTGTQSTTFWIDNVDVFERAIQWSARSVVDDPWYSNNAPWTCFNELINSATDGIGFTTRGKDLQLRAQAQRQDAMVYSAPQIVPQYAGLGQFIWPENAPPSTLLTPQAFNTLGIPWTPQAYIAAVHSTGRTYQFGIYDTALLYFVNDAVGSPPPTSGSAGFSWTWNNISFTTGYTIAYNANAAAVQSAIQASSGFPSSSVFVTGGPPPLPFIIQWQGSVYGPVTRLGPFGAFGPGTLPEMIPTGATGASFTQWSFGDGTFSNSYEPQHTYTNAGTYYVTLTWTGTIPGVMAYGQPFTCPISYTSTVLVVT